MTSNKSKEFTQSQREALLAFYSLFGNEILEQAKALLDADESEGKE